MVISLSIVRVMLIIRCRHCLCTIPDLFDICFGKQRTAQGIIISLLPDWNDTDTDSVRFLPVFFYGLCHGISFSLQRTIWVNTKTRSLITQLRAFVLSSFPRSHAVCDML